MSVCLRLFSDYRLRGGLRAIPTASVLQGQENLNPPFSFIMGDKLIKYLGIEVYELLCADRAVEDIEQLRPTDCMGRHHPLQSVCEGDVQRVCRVTPLSLLR